MHGKDIEEEAVVHHIHHKQGDGGYKREVTINGSVYSISLNSDDLQENTDYLTDKALNIIKQLKRAGK